MSTLHPCPCCFKCFNFPIWPPSIFSYHWLNSQWTILLDNSTEHLNITERIRNAVILDFEVAESLDSKVQSLAVSLIQKPICDDPGWIEQQKITSSNSTDYPHPSHLSIQTHHFSGGIKHHVMQLLDNISPNTSSKVALVSSIKSSKLIHFQFGLNLTITERKNTNTSISSNSVHAPYPWRLLMQEGA